MGVNIHGENRSTVATVLFDHRFLVMLRLRWAAGCLYIELLGFLLKLL